MCDIIQEDSDLFCGYGDLPHPEILYPRGAMRFVVSRPRTARTRRATVIGTKPRPATLIVHKRSPSLDDIRSHTSSPSTTCVSNTDGRMSYSSKIQAASADIFSSGWKPLPPPPTKNHATSIIASIPLRRRLVSGCSEIVVPPPPICTSTPLCKSPSKRGKENIPVTATSPSRKPMVGIGRRSLQCGIGANINTYAFSVPRYAKVA